ncbi:unnamed protein product [Cylindrotheca closterium]|uniref:Uncharacterized protein n=1 Tax=Cylindrotheca closterium TaxID=2856 RepID=A0AAD2FTE9_9STRA|nr:unnamed protein product [Cylindrotheca closterium]
MRAIRAILTTNNEIWDRCKGSITVQPSATHKSATFTRYEYNFAKALKVTEDGSLQVKTEAERSDLEFDLSLLGGLPDEISLLSPPFLKDDDGNQTVFVDYEAYFEKTSILHDSVIGPFLVELKTHLENVQVCLGEIDSWLMFPQDTTSFLESVFKVALETPTEEHIEKCSFSSSHPKRTCRCHYAYSRHSTSQRCPLKPRQKFKCGGCKDNKVACLGTFHSLPGMFDTEFDLTNDLHRRRLQHFVAFMNEK